MSSANSDFCLSFLSVNGGNGRQPTYDKAVAVASALGVSADYLLTGEQKEKPASEEVGFHPALEESGRFLQISRFPGDVFSAIRIDV